MFLAVVLSRGAAAYARKLFATFDADKRQKAQGNFARLTASILHDSPVPGGDYAA